jgi:ribose transport system substrate-binding protein
VQQAQDFVDQYLKPPTKIGVSEPLKSKPKPGGLIVYCLLAFATANEVADGIKAGAQAAGWSYRAIDTDIANPASVVACMQQALQYKPTAVVFADFPLATWQSEIPVFAKAGVKLVPMSEGPITDSSTVLGNLSGPADLTSAGKLIGDFFISKSAGQGHALEVYAPDNPSEAGVIHSVKATIKSGCPKCASTDLDLSEAQLSNGTGTAAVVAAIQRDPSINWVINSYGPQLPGLYGALAAAGLAGKVHVTGYGASATEFAAVKAGQYDGYPGNDYYYSGWLADDVIFRAEEGMAYSPDDGGATLELFVKGQNFNVNDAANFIYPADLATQFETLWNVAS